MSGPYVAIKYVNKKKVANAAANQLYKHHIEDMCTFFHCAALKTRDVKFLFSCFRPAV